MCVPISRRGFLGAAALWSAGRARAQVAFPGAPASDRVLFPQPRDGDTVAINPPGFAWWKAPRAAQYRLNIWNDAGQEAYTAPYLTDPVHLPRVALPPGEYCWDVEACDASDRVLARRGVWYFRVPEGLTEFPWAEPSSILDRVPGGHPRYIFLRDALLEIRRSLTAGRKRAWDTVRRNADRYLTTPLPEPPKYHTFPDAAR